MFSSVFRLLVFIIKFVLLSFHFVFDEISDFRNRLLTNQKRKQVVQNCQWKCMFDINVEVLVQKSIQGFHLKKMMKHQTKFF